MTAILITLSQCLNCRREPIVFPYIPPLSHAKAPWIPVNERRREERADSEEEMEDEEMASV